MARKEESLTPGQKMLAIRFVLWFPGDRPCTPLAWKPEPHWSLHVHRRMPSLLEYFSYNCNFMGILAGPTSSYNDYIAFIEGDPCRHRNQGGDRKSSGRLRKSEPSPNVRHMTTSLHQIKHI